MDGVFRVAVQGGLIFKVHDEADIKGGVHERAAFGNGLADGECFYFGDLFGEAVRGGDELLAVGGMAGVFQPDEADVVEFSGGGRFGRGGAAGEEKKGQAKGKQNQRTTR